MNLDRETLKKLIKESINDLMENEPVDAMQTAKDMKGLSGSGKQAVTGLAKLKTRLASAFKGVEKLQMRDKAKLAEFFVSNLLNTSANEIATFMKQAQSDKEAAAARAKKETPVQGSIE